MREAPLYGGPKGRAAPCERGTQGYTGVLRSQGTVNVRLPVSEVPRCLCTQAPGINECQRSKWWGAHLVHHLRLLHPLFEKGGKACSVIRTHDHFTRQ